MRAFPTVQTQELGAKLAFPVPFFSWPQSAAKPLYNWRVYHDNDE